MNREVRGFLVGLLVAVVVVLLIGSFGGSVGKYQLTLQEIRSGVLILDTETGKLYVAEGEKFWYLGGPSEAQPWGAE